MSCLASFQPSPLLSSAALNRLSRKQGRSLPGKVLPSGLSELQHSHVCSEHCIARHHSTSLYSCHLLICKSCDKWRKEALCVPLSPLLPWHKWRDAGEQQGDRGVMAGKRVSYSNSTSPGHLHSLVTVTGTWVFSCPMEG